MKPLIPQTVYVPIDGFTEKQFDKIGILDMARKKENQYLFTKEEIEEVIKNAIHWGVGTYQAQLSGGSPTNTQIQYYLSEVLQ